MKQLYEIGYGRPPVHTRWKKGCPSPCPTGRKKKIRFSFKNRLEALWTEKHRIQEDGKMMLKTNQEIIIQSLTLEVAKGNVRAIRDLKSVLALRISKDKPRRVIVKINGVEQ